VLTGEVGRARRLGGVGAIIGGDALEQFELDRLTSQIESLTSGC
jgi:hypothetical protein